jgi:hypothetical protein
LVVVVLAIFWQAAATSHKPSRTRPRSRASTCCLLLLLCVLVNSLVDDMFGHPALPPNARILVHALPLPCCCFVQVDPVVFNMLSEDPGKVDYSSIGGLSEQIR